MSAKPDGGPAFPRAMGTIPKLSGPESDFGADGMTLRQWYAGKALSGSEWTQSEDADGKQASAELLANACFKIADAFIQHERKGGHAYWRKGEK